MSVHESPLTRLERHARNRALEPAVTEQRGARGHAEPVGPRPQLGLPPALADHRQPQRRPAVAQPGEVIAVESPTYYGLLQILESLGLQALEIPASAHTGLSLEALEVAARQCPGLKAVAVTPNLHNPLGCVMPDAHKR